MKNIFLYLGKISGVLSIQPALVALIYQSCIKMCADLSARDVVRKDACLFHENSVNSQSQRTNQWVLINPAAENGCH